MDDLLIIKARDSDIAYAPVKRGKGEGHCHSLGFEILTKFSLSLIIKKIKFILP